MSKHLHIPKVADQDLLLDYAVLKNTFAFQPAHDLVESPWQKQFPYVPKVFFKIIHSPTYIGVCFVVEENFVRANSIRPNENVWEDSCVEFFISLDNKQTYFNFEFNAIGTGLIGYGPSIKAERKRLTAAEIATVTSLTQLVNYGGKKSWEIFLRFPKRLITEEQFSGRTIHGNFYKCGDALPDPHFLCWNAIDHPKPNFHLPEFFGELIFE